MQQTARIMLWGNSRRVCVEVNDLEHSLIKDLTMLLLVETINVTLHIIGILHEPGVDVQQLYCHWLTLYEVLVDANDECISLVQCESHEDAWSLRVFQEAQQYTTTIEKAMESIEKEVTGSVTSKGSI